MKNQKKYFFIFASDLKELKNRILFKAEKWRINY